jgi:N-acetylneuraminic acid mutarotase
LWNNPKGYEGYYDDFWSFDPESLKWTLIPQSENAPPGLHGHTAVLYDNQMIIFGGKDKDSKYFDESWSFDFLSNKWTILNAKGS